MTNQLEIRQGDLFVPSDLDGIAHGVNTRGYMASGIAAQFAERFPDMESVYRWLCETDRLHPGECFPWPTRSGWVYNLATQALPGADAQVRWISHALLEMLQHAETHGVKRIGLPQIGCGIGGLNWSTDVRPVLERLQETARAQMVVFEYPAQHTGGGVRAGRR